MNIFVTNTDPVVAATDLCDRHIPKMMLESAQMLSNGFHKLGDTSKAPYRSLMVKHPCSVWTLESRENYEWLLVHARQISREYTKRFSKIHACESVLNVCESSYRSFKFHLNGLTSFKQVMPLPYRNHDTTYAYRSYIKGGKLFAKWAKSTPKPIWYNSHIVVYDKAGVDSYIKRGIEIPII